MKFELTGSYLQDSDIETGLVVSRSELEEKEKMNLEDSNSNSGGSGICRSSKKQKQKKIPQRGLGVAQLEKIRIEELQKKDSANSVFTSPAPNVSPTHSSSLPTMPLLNYSTIHSPYSAPFPSSSPMLRHPPPPPPPMSNIDSFYLNSVPPLSHSNGGGGFDVGWPSVPTLHDSAHLHKMWRPYELNHDGESSMWDHGLPLPPNMSLPFESSPIMPLPDIMTRAPQFSQTSASSLMNMPLVNSSTILNYQMEPPSNQSLYSKYSSFWPGEEKMASAKRPYPFLLDTAPPLSFQSKLPRIASRTDEFTPFGNGSLFSSSDHVAPPLQETHLLPSSSSSEPVLKNINKENANQNVDFLTLAPPSVISPHPSPRWRHSLPQRTVENPVGNPPRAANINYRIPENPVPNSRTGLTGLNHRNVESPSANSGKGSNGFNHRQQPLFSFFPASKFQQQTSTMTSHCNSNGKGEIGGIVDLNLKL